MHRKSEKRSIEVRKAYEKVSHFFHALLHFFRTFALFRHISLFFGLKTRNFVKKCDENVRSEQKFAKSEFLLIGQKRQDF